MDQKLDEARTECQAQLFTDHHHLHEIEEAERKSLRGKAIKVLAIKHVY